MLRKMIGKFERGQTKSWERVWCQNKTKTLQKILWNIIHLLSLLVHSQFIHEAKQIETIPINLFGTRVWTIHQQSAFSNVWCWCLASHDMHAELSTLAANNSKYSLLEYRQRYSISANTVMRAKLYRNRNIFRHDIIQIKRFLVRIVEVNNIKLFIVKQLNYI